jgi:hypothetical protein
VEFIELGDDGFVEERVLFTEGGPADSVCRLLRGAVEISLHARSRDAEREEGALAARPEV